MFSDIHIIVNCHGKSVVQSLDFTHAIPVAVLTH